MVNIVFVDLCDVRTFFGSHKQFISVLWNIKLTMFVSLYGTAPRNINITYR